MAINSIYTGPRLGLRGGGASAARKEARKRKFDQVTEPDASTGGKRFISEPESADELDTAASPSAKSHEGTEHETDSSVSSGQEDKGEEARGKATEDKSNATKPKPQRFVVFVGVC